MPLPTDNETEGVIITAAPVNATPALPDPTVTQPPDASNSHLLPFRKVFRERALRITCFFSLIAFLVLYQKPSMYTLFTSDKGFKLSQGSGWVKDAPVYTGFWTDGAGKFSIPNFGYAWRDEKYMLSVTFDLPLPLYQQESIQLPDAYTLMVGSYVAGSYPVITAYEMEMSYNFDNGVRMAQVPITSSLLSAAGPDPVFTISSTTHLASDGKTKLGLPVTGVALFAPSAIGSIIPPIDTLIDIVLFAALCYLAQRRKSEAIEQSALIPGAVSASAITVLISFVMAIIWMRQPTVQPVSIYAIMVASVGLMISWRRELANWLLHLRHPADERFIVR